MGGLGFGLRGDKLEAKTYQTSIHAPAAKLQGFLGEHVVHVPSKFTVFTGLSFLRSELPVATFGGGQIYFNPPNTCVPLKLMD